MFMYSKPKWLGLLGNPRGETGALGQVVIVPRKLDSMVSALWRDCQAFLLLVRIYLRGSHEEGMVLHSAVLPSHREWPLW